MVRRGLVGYQVDALGKLSGVRIEVRHAGGHGGDVAIIVREFPGSGLKTTRWLARVSAEKKEGFSRPMERW